MGARRCEGWRICNFCGKTCESALYAKGSLPAEVHLEEIIWMVDLEQPFAFCICVIFSLCHFFLGNDVTHLEHVIHATF